ncbi:MAG TPA: aminoglycoside phosphotransferase family protein [Dermatophilaceae bacterium]|nr:aminoglycoside phosphotransferase family protein [Dermatophilaceae bacterium]
MSRGEALVPRDWLDWISRLPADGGPTGAAWARRAPLLVREVVEEWGLLVAGPASTGWTAVVLPVEQDGEPLALKVGWPNRESAAEPLALRHWGGRGAVRLVAADPGRGALLLERLDPGRTLASVPDDEAAAVIGGLLGRLHVPAPPRVRTLPAFLDEQLGRMRARTDLPRRIVARVDSLAADLLGGPGAADTLLHTDLHHGNVLGGAREPWLAIDPKPMAGHPGWEFQPLLRNRVQELGTGSAFRWSVRRRLEVAADAAGMEEDLARAWTLVHTGVECLWAAEDGDAAALTLHIALLKALAD